MSLFLHYFWNLIYSTWFCLREKKEKEPKEPKKRGPKPKVHYDEAGDPIDPSDKKPKR